MTNNSQTPTAYQTIEYDKVTYRNPTSSFSLNTSNGHITISQDMRAMINYSTTVRGTNNSYVNSFTKLEKSTNSGSSWSEIQNTNVSANTKQPMSAKDTASGNAIVDISSGDMIRARISVVRLTNTGGSDSVVITKDTFISIYDLFGGQQEPAGADGVDGADADI